MRPELVLKPNEGLGELSFGMLPVDVRDRLGLPDTTDEHSGPWPEVCFGWQYKRLGLDVFFQRPRLLWKPTDPFRLLMFTSTHAHLNLWGRRIMKLPQAEVFAFLAHHGQYSSERLEPLGKNFTTVRIPDLNLDFEFRKGRLFLCQWRWSQADRRRLQPEVRGEASQCSGGPES